MIHLYEYLYRHQKARNLDLTVDGEYFLKHRDELLLRPRYSALYEVDNEFDIVRANIILRSLDTLKTLNTAIQKLGLDTNKMDDSRLNAVFATIFKNAPYFFIEDEEAYFPLFSRVFNLIYGVDSVKLFSLPLNRMIEELDGEMVDPFEEYNFPLFGSNFTQLVLVGGDKTTRAYYHLDFQMVFIVNRQGTLDTKITLFDSKIRNINTSHIISRLKPVIQAYYDNNRIKMIDMLYQGEFISSYAYNLLLGKMV